MCAACEYVYARIWQPKLDDRESSLTTLSLSLRQGLSIYPQVAEMTSLANQLTPGDSTSPPFNVGITGGPSESPSIYMGSMDLSYSP